MRNVFLILFCLFSAGGFIQGYLNGDAAPWYETGEYAEAREARHHFDHDLHVFHVADADHSGSVTRDDWAQAEGDLARFAGYDVDQDGQVVISELVPPSLGFSPGNVVDIFTDSKFLFTCANVCFLLFLFIRFGGKPVGAFLAERRRAVEEGLEEAKRLQKEADALREQYEARLANLDAEMEQLRGEMLAAGEAEKERIVADAEAKANRMRREADFLIEQRIKQLRQELSREAVESAMAAAEAVLREQANQDDQVRVAEDYLKRLQETQNPEAQA